MKYGSVIFFSSFFSDNKEITDKSIDLLLTFTNLKVLNISGSKIKVGNSINFIKFYNENDIKDKKHETIDSLVNYI